MNWKVLEISEKQLTAIVNMENYYAYRMESQFCGDKIELLKQVSSVDQIQITKNIAIILVDIVKMTNKKRVILMYDPEAFTPPFINHQ